MESDPKLIFEFFHNSWVKPAFSRPRLQPLWKLQPPKGPGELQWTQWTHAQTHFRPAKPKEAGKKNLLQDAILQSFNSSHNKTVKHWLKTPKVSKSIQKCQSLPITVSPSTFAEPPPDRVWHRSTSYP
jgi:hypothetical protein